VLAVTRSFRIRCALVFAVVALATTAWHMSPDASIVTSDPAAGKAFALASPGHASVTPIAARGPAPCARSEQPHRGMGRLAACPGAPAPTAPSPRTPLYALLRVFRL
jgi:hypothetical protein